MAGSSPAMTIGYGVRFYLANAAFQAYGQQLLRLDREFHRQLLEDLLAEAGDDQRPRILVRQAALSAVKELVLADLRRCRLMLDAGRGVAHLDIGNGMRAAAVADQQRVALRVVARPLAPRLYPDQTAIGVLAAPGRNTLRD